MTDSEAIEEVERLRHAGVPPMEPVEDRLLTLETAVRDYLSEHDNPAPDYTNRRRLRDTLRKLVGAPPEPQK